VDRFDNRLRFEWADPEQRVLLYSWAFAILLAIAWLIVVGMYKLIPNRIGRGAHVSNASFMVDPSVQGKGAGRALGEHCLHEARRQGYDAMQFNFVVSTNTAGVALWKKLGFEIVGTLPAAFEHATLGKVDAYVMHRFLK
jgi:GNAT superfamily N-acetyltransferase